MLLQIQRSQKKMQFKVKKCTICLPNAALQWRGRKRVVGREKLMSYCAWVKKGHMVIITLLLFDLIWGISWSLQVKAVIFFIFLPCFVLTSIWFLSRQQDDFATYSVNYICIKVVPYKPMGLFWNSDAWAPFWSTRNLICESKLCSTFLVNWRVERYLFLYFQFSPL